MAHTVSHTHRVKRYMREMLGRAFHEYRCHARLLNEEYSPQYRQCQRHYGYGVNGLYCAQHATKSDNQ